MSKRPPAEVRELRELFNSTDPVPDHVLTGSYAAVALRRAGGRNSRAMTLIGDSAEEPAEVRSVAQTRVLTYAMPGQVLELDLRPTTCGLYRVSGIVLARGGHLPPAGAVVLRKPDREYRAMLDTHGAFEVRDVPRGPMSVVFAPERAEPAVADWLVC